MLNELLGMLGGGNDEPQCCDGRDQQGGIRGFLARLFGGDDDDDDDNNRDGGCCSNVTRDGDTRDPESTSDDFDSGN